MSQYAIFFFAYTSYYVTINFTVIVGFTVKSDCEKLL